MFWRIKKELIECGAVSLPANSFLKRVFSLVSVPVFLFLMLLSFYYLSIYYLPVTLSDELWIPNKKNQSEAGAFFKWSLSPTVDFLILTVGSVLNPTALNFLAVVDEVGLIVGHSRRKPSSKRQVCLSWAIWKLETSAGWYWISKYITMGLFWASISPLKL